MKAGRNEWSEYALAGAVRLESALLKNSGVRHGFLGARAEVQITPAELAHQVNAEDCLTLGQIHSKIILDLRREEDLENYRQTVQGAQAPSGLRADGVVLTAQRSADLPRLAVALRTADCIPLILCSASTLALVHAGWRGLAADIIGAAARYFMPEGENIVAAIGPCAGGESYEVGNEVIDAIGAAAVFAKAAPGKAFLNVALTAARQLSAAFGADLQLSVAGICTIEDTRFYSYRRQGRAAGRNLTYVII